MRRPLVTWLVLAMPCLVACGEREAGEPARPAGTGGTAGVATTPGGSSAAGAPQRGGAAPTAGGPAAGEGGKSSGAGAGGAASEGGFPAVDLPEGKGWLELPDTEISEVCACTEGFPEVCATSGCDGVFAWSSGAYDSLRQRLIVFGGGHSDYFGNELYSLSLSDRRMTRLNDPGLPLDSECSYSTANGSQAASRHTYDTFLYVEHADRLFTFGGSMIPCGYLSADTWSYSFADERWQLHEPSGEKPNPVPGITGDYDPVSRKIFLHDDSALYRYDLEQDGFEQLLDDDFIDYHMTGVIDPVARKLVLVGAGSVLVYGIDGDYERNELTTTGADELVGSVYPGLAFDAEQGRIVAWNGGDSAYSLDLESGVWTALTSNSGPGPANETGTFKRWRYVPGESSFVLVNGARQNAFLFRL